MQDKNISQVVISRLPRYFRYLGDLKDEGMERISSGELSKRMNVTASQIRQDFNHFGGFGQQGYGYNVNYLYEEIGSDVGPFSLESDEFLLSCYDGEKCIYQFTDKIEKVTGIRHIRVSSSKSQTVYDLQGRRVENPKQGEIYIQNGKKYINK